MQREKVFFILVTVILAWSLSSCASTPNPATQRGDMFKSFKEYPDHVFDVNEYVKGMKKGGHNLLIWKDASVDFSKYKSVNLSYFEGKLLPERDDVFSSPYIKKFNSQFSQSFQIRMNDPKGLRVEGAIVECNPGLPNAQAMFRHGDDKTYSGVACEIYEPGGTVPVIRIFTRDTATGGAWGGDLDSMMNHIMATLATRLSKKIEIQVGK